MNNLEILSVIGSIHAPDRDSLLKQVVELLHRERPHYHWVGIYLLQGKELVLGPYVGKTTSHVRIPLDQGICGAAASTGQTLIVDDVNADPRYLAAAWKRGRKLSCPLSGMGRSLAKSISIVTSRRHSPRRTLTFWRLSRHCFRTKCRRRLQRAKFPSSSFLATHPCQYATT
jgi:hypothetical protein